MEPEREKELLGNAQREGLSSNSYGLATTSQWPVGRDGPSCHDAMPGSALSTLDTLPQSSGGSHHMEVVISYR